MKSLSKAINLFEDYALWGCPSLRALVDYPRIFVLLVDFHRSIDEHAYTCIPSVYSDIPMHLTSGFLLIIIDMPQQVMTHLVEVIYDDM